MKKIAILVSVTAVLLHTTILFAQIDARPPAEDWSAFRSGAEVRFAGASFDRDSFGTSSLTVTAVSAWEFGAHAGAVISADGWGYRYLSSGIPYLLASVRVPTGALLVGLEIEGCDTNVDVNLDALLVAIGNPSGSQTSLPIGASAISSGSGGCSKWSIDLSGAGHVTNNNSWTYIVRVLTPGADGSTKFISVRLYYQRQISPAPPTATFSDVAVGHPLHQFVEALAASGITAGCGGANFCPNDPITRGQIAVFLAKALGLHWPN